MAEPSGNDVSSSAARAWNSGVYSTTGGHAAKPFASKPSVVQPVNQLVTIARTASRRLQHPALNFIGPLPGFKAFRQATDALAGAADRQQEQD